jgi:hypothetical protein
LATDSYCLAYLIDGRFDTQNGLEYLNDIIARFALTLSIKERMAYPPLEIDKQHNRIHKLKEFQNLKSMTRKFVPKLNGQMAQDDNTFWELKLWIEYQIRDNGGESNYVAFELLMQHALMFYEFKDNSTAKAKCRNIWNWYDERNWEYHILRKSTKTEEEILMTRQERARTNAQAKSDKARKAVVTAITGLYADEYKKVNGSWSISKLSDALNMSRNTVSKYLKLWEANKDGMFEDCK